MNPTPPDTDTVVAACTGDMTLVLDGRTLAMALVALVGLGVLAFVLGVLLGRGPAVWRGDPRADPRPSAADASWARASKGQGPGGTNPGGCEVAVIPGDTRFIGARAEPGKPACSRDSADRVHPHTLQIPEVNHERR